jgi:hypothetical protein
MHIDTSWLLGQDMFAGFNGLDHPLGSHARWQWNVHSIDIVAAQKALIAVDRNRPIFEGNLGLASVDERFGRRGTTTSDGSHDAVSRKPNAAPILLRDPCSRQDSPAAHFAHHFAFSFKIVSFLSSFSSKSTIVEADQRIASRSRNAGYVRICASSKNRSNLPRTDQPNRKFLFGCN